MSRLLHAATFAVATLLLGGAVLASGRTAEDGSLFAAGVDGHPLLADAKGLGLDVHRMLGGPASLPSAVGDDAPRTLLLIVSPTRAFDAAEAAQAEQFLRSGGTILVADAYGEGNSLAAPLGILFHRVRLAEPPGSVDFAVAGVAFPVPLLDPTALKLDPTLASTDQAWSSAHSFLDLDGNGLIGAGEPVGPFLVAATVPVGQGRFIAVADPMQVAAPTPEARAWRQALLRGALPTGGMLLVDESHGGLDDPVLAGMGVAARASGDGNARTALIAFGAVATLACLLPVLDPVWGTPRFRPLRFRRRAPIADAEAAAVRLGSFWLGRGVAAMVAALALACLALAGGNEQAAWAAAILGVAVASAIGPGVAALRGSRTLDLEQVPEGGELRVVLEVQGRRGRPLVDIADTLPSHMEVRKGTASLTARVGPAGLRHEYVLAPALRGTHQVGPLLARREDVLALRASQAQVVPATALRVVPALQDVRRMPFGTRLPTITLGPHLVNRAGEGSEFQALRMYQSGDSMRTVNWKASARSRDLMVNQRVHESQALLTIFLDAREVAGAGPEAASPLADGCRAVLSMATGALRVRDRIRIVVYGDGVSELPSMPSAQQLHELTGLLATVPARGSTGLGEAVSQVLPTLRPGRPVLVASGLEADPSFVDAVRELRGRGLLPVVLASPVSVRPSEAEDGGDEPGAQAILDGRRDTIAGLRGLGIPVHETRRGLPLDLLFKLGGSA